jgi:NitT/TauT family transport system ATP-binding protein
VIDDAYVRLSAVGLRYGGIDGGVLALDGVDFEVRKGEFVAVVGPSGCGKSTLLKAVTGLWPVTEGRVSVGGNVVYGPLKVVGMAFQNATLLPWRNVIGNVLLPLEIVEPHRSEYGSRRAEYEARALDLLRLVGLDGFHLKNVWELSGGMQQRAQLCRALIHDPKLLMLDEPFGALDAFTREDLWGVLQRLWLEKRPTIVMVTHDLREAAYLADRIVVMSARPGRIIAERQVTDPRPRPLSITFEHAFVDMIHELRDLIDRARGIAAGDGAAS